MNIMNMRIIAASAVLLSILSPVANASPVRAKMNAQNECIGVTEFKNGNDCLTTSEYSKLPTNVTAQPSDVKNLNDATSAKFDIPRKSYKIIYKTDPNAFLPNGKYDATN
jgi:uncharacterized membrane protein